MATTQEEVAKLLLEIGAVTLRPQDPYRFASGILSPVYSDHRLLMGSPKHRSRIMVLMANEVWKLGVPDMLAGTAMGAIPHAALISNLLNIPFVYVRNKPKDHGKQNLVEGSHQPGKTAIVVEDLISTGISSITTAQALRGVGCIVKDIVCITTYSLKSSKENLKRAKINLHSLTTFPTIVNVAIRMGMMQAEDKKLVLNWLNDPKGWGKRMGFEK